MSTRRLYVGTKQRNIIEDGLVVETIEEKFVFRSRKIEVKGTGYKHVIGPFQTRRAAEFVANNDVEFDSIRQAERMVAELFMQEKKPEAIEDSSSRADERDSPSLYPQFSGGDSILSV